MITLNGFGMSLDLKPKKIGAEPIWFRSTYLVHSVFGTLRLRPWVH